MLVDEEMQEEDPLLTYVSRPNEALTEKVNPKSIERCRAWRCSSG